MEYSAGAIVRNSEGKFLVIMGQHGFWGFPKGHIEKGESIEKTVKREVMEEVGIEIEMLPIQESIEYLLENGKKKKATFFLANLKSGKVKKSRIIPSLKAGAFGILNSKVALKCGALDPSDFGVIPNKEVKEFRWVTKKEALAILSFDNLKQIFARILIRGSL